MVSFAAPAPWFNLCRDSCGLITHGDMAAIRAAFLPTQPGAEKGLVTGTRHFGPFGFTIGCPTAAACKRACSLG